MTGGRHNSRMTGGRHNSRMTGGRHNSGMTGGSKIPGWWEEAKFRNDGRKHNSRVVGGGIIMGLYARMWKSEMMEGNLEIRGDGKEGRSMG